jgi:phosphatidylserine/phosphatidylglycerophosphate/cardiolipin synthase-like enzyme
MIWAKYFEICRADPAAVEAVEEALLAWPSLAPCSAREMALEGKGISYDSVARVLDALEDIGALAGHEGRGYTRVLKVFDETGVQRHASLAALKWTSLLENSDSCEVLVAQPRARAGGSIEKGIELFSDLRTTVRSLLGEAQRSVIIASPYWDVDVAEDLGALLERRLTAGVGVRVLAREAREGTQNLGALRCMKKICGAFTNFSIGILEEPSASDPFGSYTFHFKAACADAKRVYLGSANFNTAGLGSRWELGVVLRGQEARRVCRLLETLGRSARRFEG